MNRAQHIIIIIYCISVALACFYVPWEMQSYKFASGGHLLKLGWSLIWSPPKITIEGKETKFSLAKVDINIVVLEILGITALAAMAFTLAGAFKKKIKKCDQ